MKTRIVSNWRALIGFGLLAVLYVICPLDLMPGMPIDDLVAGTMFCFLAYAKGTSPISASNVEQL